MISSLAIALTIAIGLQPTAIALEPSKSSARSKLIVRDGARYAGDSTSLFPGQIYSPRVGNFRALLESKKKGRTKKRYKRTESIEYLSPVLGFYLDENSRPGICSSVHRAGCIMIPVKADIGERFVEIEVSDLSPCPQMACRGTLRCMFPSTPALALTGQ